MKGFSRFVDERFDIFSAFSFVLSLEVKRKSFVFDLSVNTGHFPQILSRAISTLLYTTPQRYQVLKDVSISKFVIRTGLWEWLRSVQIFNAILPSAFSTAA